MRGRAKTINFATIYGQGPHALSRQLKITHAEAKEFIERYFERFHRVREYLDSMVEYAREHGYVQTIFNRRRYIPELRDRNFNIRAFGERTAANSPIQGSAADLIKVAMIRIHDALADAQARRDDAAAGARRARVRGAGRRSSTSVQGARRSTRWSTPPSSRCRWSSTSGSATTGSRQRWTSSVTLVTGSVVARCRLRDRAIRHHDRRRIEHSDALLSHKSLQD